MNFDLSESKAKCSDQKKTDIPALTPMSLDDSWSLVEYFL